ncbi:aminoglycoside phosphotransferase family protein [Antribacter sp. KLBMP9083]|uniref:Aminoglycoside phosphotransferase family protein n=1 Tax=Antribacter soli TaxID=2910976 RepID=A0AA41QAV1_9MICO|nr:aminoglycoside phosphotransferase family protein [Antribacter soli]MCF4119726.1 aminoglycoside phosphotransferase family protein [Antribacter soli]
MTRVRPTWPELPEPVREAIEERLCSTVTGWTSHDGGYSPGLASTLRTADGSLFVKAVATSHEVSTRFYRDEAVRAAALPEGVPAPRFRWHLEIPADGGWVAVASDAVEGRPPRTDPWDPDDLAELQCLARRIAEHEVPAGGAFPEFWAGWGDGARLADERPAGLATYDPWLAANLDRIAGVTTPDRQAEAFGGPRLVHGDLRGDNAVLLTAPGAAHAGAHTGAHTGASSVAVDWPNAVRGAAFLDQTGMLPAVQVEGGPAPEEVLARHPLPAGTDPEALTCWVAVLTAYFVARSVEPPPPGIPHVRAFQRAQAEACIPWLRQRLAARRG